MCSHILRNFTQTKFRSRHPEIPGKIFIKSKWNRMTQVLLLARWGPLRDATECTFVWVCAVLSCTSYALQRNPSAKPGHIRKARDNYADIISGKVCLRTYWAFASSRVLADKFDKQSQRNYCLFLHKDWTQASRLFTWTSRNHEKGIVM